MSRLIAKTARLRDVAYALGKEFVEPEMQTWLEATSTPEHLVVTVEDVEFDVGSPESGPKLFRHFEVVIEGYSWPEDWPGDDRRVHLELPPPTTRTLTPSGPRFSWAIKGTKKGPQTKTLALLEV